MVRFLYIFKKISNSLIPSFIIRDVREWLRLLNKKGVMWAYHSGHSQKMSDNERFTQVTHQKWAKRSFFEWITHLIIIWSFVGKKQAIH